MKKIFTLLVGFISVGLLAAQVVDPALIKKEKIDFNNLKFGATKPVVANNELILKSTKTNTSSAKLNTTADGSKGIKIAFEYLESDGIQDNPFPRILESEKVSIHFNNSFKSVNKELKILVSGKVANTYAQAIIPVNFKANKWRKVIAEIDPINHALALSIDGERKVVPMNFDADIFQNINFIIGSVSLAKFTTRGFSGKIKNLEITTPHSIENIANMPTRSKTPLKINGEEVKHFLVSRVKNRHQAFPGIAKLADGRLAVVFREGEDHVCPYGRICVVYSKDNGKNWSAPISIPDTASDERDPSIHQLADGRILIAHGGWNSWIAYGTTSKKYAMETEYIKQAGPANFGGSRYVFSDDNGESWNKPIKIPAFAPHGPAIYNNHFYQPTLTTENGKRQVYMYKGSLDGKKWERLALVGESEMKLPGEAFEEPHTTVLADGTFVTAIRVPRDGYMRISISKDEGKTWSTPVKTEVRGFPQHLLPLKDGRLLATYGYRYYPFGIRACISNDGGKTWDMKNEFIIQDNGANFDLGYPVSIEEDNGNILTVYYHITEKNPLCFIEGARWKVKK